MNFDESKGYKFATLASKCIANEILMMIRRNKKHRGVASFSDVLTYDKQGKTLELEEILVGDPDVDIEYPLPDIVSMLPDCSHTEFYKVYITDLLSGEVKNQRDYAAMFGMSQSYASRVMKKLHTHLQKKIPKEELVV